MRGDIQSVYSVNDIVRVVDKTSPYFYLEGKVARIGLANPFVLLHVVFEGRYGNSPMTVYERQVSMVDNTSDTPITIPEPKDEPIIVTPGLDSEPVINVANPDQVIVPTEAHSEPVVKRGRGRPKGSKNKPK